MHLYHFVVCIDQIQTTISTRLPRPKPTALSSRPGTCMRPLSVTCGIPTSSRLLISISYHSYVSSTHKRVNISTRLRERRLREISLPSACKLISNPKRPLALCSTRITQEFPDGGRQCHATACHASGLNRRR